MILSDPLGAPMQAALSRPLWADQGLTEAAVAALALAAGAPLYVPSDTSSIFPETTGGVGAPSAPGGSLFANSGFDTDITGVVAGPGSPTLSWDAGRLKIESSGANYPTAAIAIPTVIGASYYVTCDVVSASSAGTDTAQIIKSDSQSSVNVNRINLSSALSGGQSMAATFIATAETTYIHAEANLQPSEAVIDNWTVEAASPSSGGNGGLPVNAFALELVPNGAFESDIRGVKPTSSAALSWSAGKLLVETTSSNYAKGTIAIPTVPGATYRVQVDVSEGTANTFVLKSDSPDSGNVNRVNIALGQNFPDGGNYSADNTFVAAERWSYIHLETNTHPASARFDNLSVTLESAPAAIRLDKRFMGGEPASAYIAAQAEVSPSTASVSVNAATGTVVHAQAMSLTADTYYLCTVTITNFVSGDVRLEFQSGQNTDYFDESQTFLLTPGASGNVQFRTQGATELDVAISVKEVPGDHASAPSASGSPTLKESAGVVHAALDGTNDAWTVTETGSADTTIVVALRTSDALATLYEGDTAGEYVGLLQDGDAGSPHAGSGAPSYHVDGIEVAGATRDSLHAALADGAWHVLRVSGADLSGWTQRTFSGASKFTGDVAAEARVTGPTAAQIAALESFVGAQAGLSL